MKESGLVFLTGLTSRNMFWPLSSMPGGGISSGELRKNYAYTEGCQGTKVIKMSIVQGTISTQLSELGEFDRRGGGLKHPAVLNRSSRPWARAVGMETLTTDISLLNFYVLFLPTQIESIKLSREGRKGEQVMVGVVRILLLWPFSHLLGADPKLRKNRRQRPVPPPCLQVCVCGVWTHALALVLELSGLAKTFLSSLPWIFVSLVPGKLF